MGGLGFTQACQAISFTKTVSIFASLLTSKMSSLAMYFYVSQSCQYYITIQLKERYSYYSQIINIKIICSWSLFSREPKTLSLLQFVSTYASIKEDICMLLHPFILCTMVTPFTSYIPIITVISRSRNCCTVSKPMPRPPPVTIATRPLWSKIPVNENEMIFTT